MARTVDISIPATAFIPATSNGAQFVAHTHSSNIRPALAFDAGDVTEIAVSVPFVMPASYAAGALKVDVYFYSASSNTGTAAWTVVLEAVTASEDTLDLEASSNFPTGTTDTASLTGTTTGDLIKKTIALSDTSKDSVAAGDQVRLLVSRAYASDDVSGDLFIPFVVLYEGT